MTLCRRTFLKSSVGGAAAGVALTSGVVSSVEAATTSSATVWKDKMPINPAIDNMKVVCMHDPKMCDVPEGSSFPLVNKAVKDDIVRTNMDKMAMELTGKTTANDAWKTIFRSGKAWKDTKVMLKVNTVEKTMLARVSVIKKIADVLIDFGVQPSNMVLFDGQGAAYAQYTNFVSLTDDTKIRCVLSNKMDSMGGRAAVTIPNVTGSGAPKDLVDGKTDIIVNIAVNKGHASPTFGVGLTTLCLKNHYGTFLESSGMATNLHNTNALININKIASIVGGDPVRQQLCIIDTLWGCVDGPGAGNGAKFSNDEIGKNNRLIMGTFAGAVDYCCVKKIREPIQKAKHDANIPKFVTEFGYKETDPVWVEMTPTGTTIEKVNPPAATKTVDFVLINASFRTSTLRFNIPEGNMEPLRTRIFDLRGSLVAEMQHPANVRSISWDGRSTGGRSVRTGNYVVQISSGNFKDTERMTILK